MAGIHYISIPTIDDCNLPNEIIDKCYKAYEYYGKYKIYDILNEELNSSRYSYDVRNRFKNINLIKRYLYLYRQAMVQTMSFVYNTEEFELLDPNIYTDDETNCPKCGKELKVLPQRGEATYYPLSHYRDIQDVFDKIVTYNRYPVRDTLNITFNEYVSSLKPADLVDFKFMFWSDNKDGNLCDGEDLITNFLKENGDLILYACYASSATISENSSVLVSTKITKTVRYDFRVYLKDLINCKIEKPVKAGYIFNNWTLDDGNELPVDLNVDQLNTDIIELLNDTGDAIDVVDIFTGNKETSDYILNYDDTIRDFEELFSAVEKENYTFKGFTFGRYDKSMGGIEIRSISVFVNQTKRMSTILHELEEDESNIPWGYLDRIKYDFEYWTSNSNGDKLTSIQENASIPAGTNLTMYAVFKDVYDEDCKVRDMQELYADTWGENKVVLFSQYAYNIPEGTYCYDDSVYTCQKSNYIYKLETTLVSPQDNTTLKTMIDNYLTETYGNNETYPTLTDETFYGWSNKSNGDIITSFNKKYEEGISITLYAVFKHDNKHWGIDRFYKYNTNGGEYCPICNKRNSYIGRYNEYTKEYDKDGNLDILRYTTFKGVLGWQKRYQNGDNETTYGTIIETASLNTLETMNKSSLIPNGTMCVDTSRYADSSNSSYKIYVYNNRRDKNYDPSSIIVDEDEPELLDKKWIYLPKDEITLTPVDTTGKDKLDYKLTGYVKCYLKQDGTLETVRTTSDGKPLEIKLKSLASTFGVNSTVEVTIGKSEDKSEYRIYYNVIFSGTSINSEMEYNEDEDTCVFKIERPLIYSDVSDCKPTLEKYIETGINDPSKVSEWFGSDTVGDFIIEGGYLTSDSEKNIKIIKPDSSFLDENGVEHTVSYYDRDKYVLEDVTVSGVEQVTIRPKNRISLMSVGIAVPTDNTSISESTEDNTGLHYVDSEGNEVVDLSSYNGLNYSGWHWIREDITKHYSIDDNIQFELTNPNNYPVAIKELLDAKDEDPKIVNGKRYIFTAYSLDGYVPITQKQLDTTFVNANGTYIIHKIYTSTVNAIGVGIVESNLFLDSNEDIAKSGFKRVLFVAGFNSTGKLVRYCDNETCYSKIRDIYQRKWSYHNQNATVKNTSTGMSSSNLSLDDYNYPTSIYKTKSDLWRYNKENQNESVMLHRGGSGDIDFYRFDFEYKYATDEFNSKKNAHPSIVSGDYKSYVLKTLLKRIKGTDIVPMTDRPLKDYQDKYKEKLYQRFNEIYSAMIEYTPYHLLNDDEINIMNDILQELPYKFRLGIISFLNTWDHYVKYSIKEWIDPNFEIYKNRIISNFNTLFESNKLVVKNVTYYKKNEFDKRILTPLFNSIYNIILNEESGYKIHNVSVPITNENFEDPTSSGKVSVGSILDYVKENYNPYALANLSATKYKFVRWTVKETGEEPTTTDKNVFVNIGTSENPSQYTLYAYFKEIYVDIIAEKNIDESWFKDKDTFVDRYYTDEELMIETEAFFSELANRVELGVDKSWWFRTYNNSDTDTYTIDDFINSFTDIEFVKQFDKLVNTVSEEITFETGTTENMILDSVIAALENQGKNNDRDDAEFAYWSLDGYTEIDEAIKGDISRKYSSYSTVKLYKVYQLKNHIGTSNFSKDWFNGKDYVLSYIKNSLASYHEQLAIPITFITYMFGLMIWPKRIAVMTDSKGEIGSYMLSSDTMVSSNDVDSRVLMHKTASSGNNSLDIKFSVVSKRFPAAIDENNGNTIYEQYYIASEAIGTSFKVYSFMKNAWVDEFLSGNDIYDYCMLLKNTSNPALSYNPSKLINIVPYSSNEYVSNLCIIYNTCIILFDCYANKWLNVITPNTLFESSNTFIKNCTYNKEKNVLYILSSKNEISTIDLNTNSTCPSNYDSDNNIDSSHIFYIPGVKPAMFSLEPISLLSASVSDSETIYVDESAVLIRKIANIEPYVLEDNERPWILDNRYSETPILPREISEKYYNELSLENREKYNINEKLTLRYGFEKLGELTPESEIEYSGNKYNFKRLSFYNNGISITENQLNKRLTGSIGVYAVYHKDGVLVSEKQGYMISVLETQTRSKSFADYLKEQKENQGTFDTTSAGHIEDYELPQTIDKIYSIEGFEIGGEYNPVICAVTGTRVKILRFYNGTFEVISTVDYNDNVPIMSIISSDSGRRTYIVYKNQRITVLTTYMYLPSIFKPASTTGEEVTVVGSTDNIRNLFINYYTNKRKLHCVKLGSDTFADDEFYGRQLSVDKYIEKTGGVLTTYLDTKIDQSDFNFYSTKLLKHTIFKGENTDISKIN